jgi:hypothetical protein
MKTEILKRIVLEQLMLSDEDANSHVWWNRFEEFIRAIPEDKYGTVHWQLCPKCNGEGVCDNIGTSSSTHRMCPVCNGAKVITPRFVIDEREKIEQLEKDVSALKLLYKLEAGMTDEMFEEEMKRRKIKSDGTHICKKALTGHYCKICLKDM